MPEREKFFYYPTAKNYAGCGEEPAKEPGAVTVRPEKREYTVDQTVTLAGMTMKNPIVMASGTFGFGEEYGQFFDLSELGGICVKGLTPARREGNPPPRIAETPMGMLNSVGLQNPGVDAFLAHELPRLKGRAPASSPTSRATPRRSTARCARSSRRRG